MVNFFPCKVLKGRLGLGHSVYTFLQVSDIGYCEYFNMSRANKLSKLRGQRYNLFRNVSDNSRYHFFRGSDWAKMKRRWRMGRLSE